jgi:hypothetical protein
LDKVKHIEDGGEDKLFWLDLNWLHFDVELLEVALDDLT